MRVNVRYMSIVCVKRYPRRRQLTNISENYIDCTNEEAAATFTINQSLQKYHKRMALKRL